MRTVPCVHICTTTKCSRAPRLLLQLLPKSLHPSSLAIHGYTSPKQAKPCCIASSPPTPRRDDPPPTRLRPARVSNRSHAFHPRAPGPVRVSAAVSTCHLVIILPFALSRRNQLPIRWYTVLCRSSCAKHPVAQSTAQSAHPSVATRRPPLRFGFAVSSTRSCHENPLTPTVSFSPPRPPPSSSTPSTSPAPASSARPAASSIPTPTPPPSRPTRTPTPIASTAVHASPSPFSPSSCPC